MTHALHERLRELARYGMDDWQGSVVPMLNAAADALEKSDAEGESRDRLVTVGMEALIAAGHGGEPPVHDADMEYIEDLVALVVDAVLAHLNAPANE